MLDRGDANGELEAIHAICSLADHTSSHAGLALGLASLVALASGEDSSQSQAMATVHKLSTGGEPEARAALACSDAAIALLVQQLSGDAAARASAMSSLLQLCDNEEARSLMVAAGGIAPLVAVAKANDLGSSTRREAALVLSSLSTAANATSIAEAGGVGVLIGALELSARDPLMTLRASSALRELVACDAGRSAILSEGVPACVQLLSNESEAVQLNSLDVLKELTNDDAAGQAAVCAAGGATPLVKCARPEAISILCQLTHQAPERPSLITAGVVPPLVLQLSADSAAKEAAMRALEQLSGAEGGPSALVRAGSITPLVALMESGTESAQAHAVSAMHNLARCAKTISAVASDATAISANVKVLEHCANAEVRAAAAATLGCVSDADVREAVVSCGGVEAL